jgi:tetratricopeptide (TPR) repeat protein
MSLRRKMRRRSRAPDDLLEIVYEPLPQGQHASMSEELRETLPGLHERMTDDPGAAVPELRAWIAREPNPMLFNWLGMAYGLLGDVEAARETARENYRRNPRYLFARLNHAELCLRDGDLAGALQALGGSLDIHAVLGGRRRAHVSEVAGYFYAAGLYHLASGDRGAAARLYAMLAQVAPEEPATEALGEMLHARPRDPSSSRAPGAARPSG